MRSFIFGIAFLAVVVSAASACDGDTTTGNGSTADGGGNGGGDSATGDDAAPNDGGGVDSGLFPAGTTKIVFTSKGGGPNPTPPDGSVCEQVDITYTIVLPARDLSWQVCEGTGGAPYTYRTGQKTLDAMQYAGVEATLRALTRTTTVQCGADKPNEQITFTTPSGDVTYYDDFYFCDPNDTKFYVHGLEDVFTALTLLAQ